MAKHDSEGTKTSTTKKKTGPKTGHSRSYPRGVGLDFRKLPGLTLVSYIDHHGVKVRPEAPPSELAVAVARHFEQMEADEEEVIGGFLERLEEGPTVATEYSRKTQRYPIKINNNPTNGKNANKGKKGKDGKTKGDAKMNILPGGNNGSSANNGNTASIASSRGSNRKRTKWAARPGEQVAAKVTRTDENGSWILASVQRFYVDTETYDVQDEDDTSKLIRLPWSHVMRLSTGAEGCFLKGADCMAIFPETTSFYKSKVAKSPVWKLDHGFPCVKEIVVQFDDDEDATTGKTPKRRVPSRYVIPVPSAYFYDEHEDVDLSPPTTTNRAK
mmetsp:Transcript_26009/g.55714  ORF Transcript_26009/g.55714 Transcript_26009/m.55714 type:complete len:329 (+) Transcript_26009:221-1207(+)|eukprot:CAMPEP_0201117774 /NCGR_PEP_ID=MMETSP0850-20130426/1817_1 /ASSEMBLY_ACC=CAM_ASM_000622 /TAXON_ID=183588 /ORGANISM="Pseudo-nitzschia fraudulenta, Strain WWA7" /LENGTH=328 /DNA_ID=CAMNT_0047382401 /DNA_START=185 /DNA_END=1171 /DNA_ORIENTATION=+